MTDWSCDFMSRDGQLFPRSVGEIFAKLLRSRFPRDTAKHIERKYEVEPSTAKNVAKGHVSERSLTSILYGEGEDVYHLLDALGLALTGLTRDEWEEQRLQKIIEEANRAQESIRRLHSRRALLDEGARTLDEADTRTTIDPQRRTAN